MPPSATPLRHPEMLLTHDQENVFESAHRPQRWMMRLRPTVATAGRSSQIPPIVRLCLKVPHIRTTSHVYQLNVASYARFPLCAAGGQAPAPEHEVLAAALQAAETEAKRPSAPSSLPAIPPDLARRLGPEGVQYLWGHVVETRAYPQRSEDWHICLPYLINDLLAKLSMRQVEDPIESLKTEISLSKQLMEALQKLVKQDAYVAHLEERLGIPPPDEGDRCFV